MDEPTETNTLKAWETVPGTYMEMPSSHWDLLLEINQRRVKYGSTFNQLFHVSVQKFWDITTGFDVVKFDEWLKTPEDISTKDFVTQEYGERAAGIVSLLIGEQQEPENKTPA